MPKRTSLKDIATEIGVSTALVSYVLNGKEKEARVGKAMVKKIRKVAVALNYQPNLIARGLKSGKTKTIGLIVADISNPFFATLSRIIENEAQQHGYTVIFGSSDEQIDKSKNLIDTLLNRQVDGLIITPVEGSKKQIEDLKKKNIPFMLIDRAFSNKDTNAVVINNYDAAYNAVSLLIKNGYKKIGMVAYDTTLTHMQDRMNGYKDGLKKNGLKFNANLLKNVSYAHTSEDVKAWIDKMFKGKPLIDAVLFATNSISVSALKLIYKLNINVPKDLGVICFDESDVYDFFYTPVSYVKQNLEAIGKNAVQLLIAEIEQEQKCYKKTIVEAELIIRESSGPAER